MMRHHSNLRGADLVEADRIMEAGYLPRSVTVIGRFWHDSRSGNTYHSCIVLLDGQPYGERQGDYGYGEQYETTAMRFLQRVGIGDGDTPGKPIPEPGPYEAPWRYWRRLGVAYFATITRVGRKKDL